MVEAKKKDKYIIISKSDMFFTFLFWKPLFKSNFWSFRFEYSLELYLIFIVNKQSFQISLIN